MRLGLAVALVAALGGRAAAQSTRYPPPVIDVDEEKESYSELWENAIEPGREQYDELVARARKLLEGRGGGGASARADAQDLLVEATELLPRRADAWAWLGLAREKDSDWTGCRDALDRAWAIAPGWADAPRKLGVAVGVCRGRGGDRDGALEVLERLVARGDDGVETLWRLGEIYMALGRLDDAIAVLEVALDQSPADIHYTSAAWTMAVAADRARDPDRAEDAAAIALRLDGERVRVRFPAGGFLESSDLTYFEMIAAAAAGADEEALFDARRYLAVAPDSPWTERVEQHARAYARIDFARRVTVKGTELADAATAQEKLAAAGPDFQKCLARTPRLRLRVTVTVVSPPAKDKPVTKLPAPGAVVTVEDTDETGEATQAAIACVQKAASAVSLPRPATPGTWTSATAPLIRAKP